MQNIIVKFPGCSKCNADNINKWLQWVSTELGFKFSNDEISKRVMKNLSRKIKKMTLQFNQKQNLLQVLACFETALKLMEWQPECNHVQLLAIKCKWDLVAFKWVSISKQLSLLEIFI